METGKSPTPLSELEAIQPQSAAALQAHAAEQIQAGHPPAAQVPLSQQSAPSIQKSGAWILWLGLGLALLFLVAAGAGAVYWFSGPPRVPPLPAIKDALIRQLAEETYEKLQANPRSAEAWGEMGMVLQANEMADSAHAFYQVAERLDPNDARWPYLQGLDLLFRSAKGAVPKLRRACALDGQTMALRFRLAEMLVTEGQFEEGQEILERLLEEYPEHASSRMLAGQVALNQGKLEKALQLLLPAARDRATAKQAKQLLSQVYLRLGRQEEADQAHNEARLLKEGWPSWDAYLIDMLRHQTGKHALSKKMDALDLQRNYLGAAEMSRIMIKDYPDYDKGHFFLGYFLLRAVDEETILALRREYLAEARKAFEKADQLTPNKAETIVSLALVTFEENPANLDKAVAIANKAIALLPGDTKNIITVAIIFQKANDLEQAAETLRRGLVHNAEAPEFHEHLAFVYFLQGRFLDSLFHNDHIIATDGFNLNRHVLLHSLGQCW